VPALSSIRPQILCCLRLTTTQLWPVTMPTNILRQKPRPLPAMGARVAAVPRIALLEAAGFKIRIKLCDTLTAARIWAALPIHSTAETWGESIHFEVPVKTGRERNARLNVQLGDICFWSEDDRILIGFGPTPISMPEEIRLMRPCNIWAQALDDVRVLSGIKPGQKIALKAAV
jgi:uncharacterized protein